MLFRSALEFQIGPMSSAVLVSSGTVTLNGATPVSVVNALVTANSIIIFTLKTAAGTQGAYPVATPSAGVGFNVKGTALDTGVYNWTVIG